MQIPNPFTFNILLLALGSLAASANNSAPKHLEAGDPLPQATLHRADGSPIDLREAVAETPAVLIFYRGGWCPYCNAHLAGLMDIEQPLREAGYQLLAISPDQPSILHDAPKRVAKPAYELLSDAEMKLSDALGISFVVPDETVARYKDYGVDLEKAAGQAHHKLPHPAVFVVGTDGVITFAHINPDYKNRLAPEKILEAARQPPAR